jgi:hypothetical protein
VSDFVKTFMVRVLALKRQSSTDAQAEEISQFLTHNCGFIDRKIGVPRRDRGQNLNLTTKIVSVTKRFIQSTQLSTSR